MRNLIDTIYLDIDDVLNTLSATVLRHYGVDQGRIENDYPLGAGYNLPLALSILTGEPPLELSEFWGLPRDLWSTVPLSEEFWVLDYCAQLVGEENVFLATSPVKCPECLAGKFEWIVKFLPEWIHRQYFITPRKTRLGAPHALLIDDYEGNCDGFVARHGHTILVPRPWNRNHGLDTNTYLFNSLKFYF